MTKYEGIRVCVEYEEICTHNERGSYGSWSESYNSRVTIAYAVDADDCCSYHSEVFIVPEGTEKVYVVYMIYDTGDSFGSATGKIDILHCFASEEKAHELAQYVSSHANEFSIKMVDDFGRDISIYNNGAGYFERISYIEVESYDIGTRGLKRRYNVN